MTSKKKVIKEAKQADPYINPEIDFTNEKLLKTVFAGFNLLEEDIKNGKVKVKH